MAKAKKEIETRSWSFVLYPDSDSYEYDNVIDIVKECPSWAYIIHDRDTNDDGEQKKTHTHCLVKFKSAKKLHQVSEKFGIPENMFRAVKSFQQAEKYLCHLTEDSADKARYNVSEVVTNIDDFERRLGVRTEGFCMSEVFETIEMGETNPYAIAKFYCHYGDYSVIRRNWSIIKGYCEFVEERKKLDKSKPCMGIPFGMSKHD